MPVVSIFYGITIRIYPGDHNPPHFHAEFGNQEILVDLRTGRTIKGRLPRRARKMLEEWRSMRISELEKAWKEAAENKLPRKIRPLR